MAKRKKQNCNITCSDKSQRTTTKGICRSFRSKTTTSARTRMAAELLDKELKRDIFNIQLLNDKFSTLVRVKPKDVEDFKKMKEEHTDKKIFFSGKKISKGKTGEQMSAQNYHCITVQDNERLRIHNVIENGSILCIDEASGDIVFALLPRRKSTSYNHFHSFIDALKVLETCAPADVSVRGNKRTVVYEGNKTGQNYLTYGVAPKRNGRGLYMKHFDGFSGTKHENAVISMRSFISTACSAYIPSMIKSGMKSILKLFNLNPNCLPLDDASDNNQMKQFISFFPSMASGRNTSLELHEDDDAFLSVVSIYNEDDIMVEKVNSKKRKKHRTVSRLKKQSLIVKYFTFGVGHSVALRTGDILVFNPLIEHCISTKTDECQKSDVYCVSFYFKSLVLGLNDNSIPLK